MYKPTENRLKVLMNFLLFPQMPSGKFLIIIIADYFIPHGKF